MFKFKLIPLFTVAVIGFSGLASAQTLELSGTDAEGYKHLRKIEDVVLPAIASGKIVAKIDGKAVVVSTAEHSLGSSKFDKHDAKKDKHERRQQGRKLDAPALITFAPAQ